MDIKSASFVTSMSTYQTPSPALPQIAIAGKSNVGKSSLINKLCNRKALAKTSATPGKTRLINLFLLNNAFHLVDLPGYGFAKVDKQEKLRWGEMMERYFRETGELRLTLHLVDIRHEPTQDDIQMNAFLRGMNLPFLVIATKSDKISRGARMKYLAPICRSLQVQPWQVICASSETGDGRDQILAEIEKALTVETGKSGNQE
ncbi:MAG: YihA family ribosome biogenesis GTP-binding protein [Clostridiales bacterium]|nr:YihA family ribosome biogenesis GTP-binding protein [Clostridiales bacterium]